MGLFRFTNTHADLIPRAEWKPGDPWDEHYRQTGYDDRDRQLEDFVNAEYVRRDFTVRLTQVGVITQTAEATFVRAAKVHVELTINILSAGTAGFEMYVTPTGLPLGTGIGAYDGSSMGTFVYFQMVAGVPVGIIEGGCTWGGAFVQFWAGGSRVAALGADPNFGAANGDLLIANFSYLPKETV